MIISNSITEKSFIEEYQKALHDAAQIVSERDQLGRNRTVTLPAMFPHGSRDPLFIVYMKSARALGELEAENFQEVREELKDIINYAAFALALLELAP